MRRLFQRARVLVFGLALIAAFVPAGRADAAGACGYVRVLTVNVPLIPQCAPADCPDIHVETPPLAGTETFVCVSLV